MKKFLLLAILLAVHSSTHTLSDRLAFYWEHLKSPFEVGSVTPSSEETGKAITTYLLKHTGSANILEIGAGPGSGITNFLVKNLKSSDRLTFVEINSNFAAILRDKYGHIPNITVVEGDILTFKPDKKFDYIISSLPLTALSKEFIESYFEHLETLIRPHGIVSYIQYMGVSLRMLLGSVFRSKSLKDKIEVINRFKKKWLLASTKVFRNIPPTYVHHLQIA
ncbi:MAG TPA: methyltransferase domain-containing protein [Candidatus Babeliales bacterium]|nr:methyltransferase domain-containing protein [Candidatus Babeliales bacterium]